ncbi:hypothetical protein ABE485_06145 [Achromobacter spanius]|uniref:hypothetical protein n=1 Tax=Achromobacter spanius TaxID=217203 RepID=UPI0032085FDA
MKSCCLWLPEAVAIAGVAIGVGLALNDLPTWSEVQGQTWAAWVQAIGSIAAIVAAIWIASEQHRTTEKREKAQRDEASRNYLCSTRDELSVLWGMYSSRVGAMLEAHDPSTWLDIIWPIDHDPFVVYNSNAQMLAQVNDDQLRAMIIQTYAQGKGLISTWRMHNGFVSEVLRLKRYAFEFPSDATWAAADGAEMMAQEYVAVLKETHIEMASSVSRCIERLDQTIKRLDGSF